MLLRHYICQNCQNYDFARRLVKKITQQGYKNICESDDDIVVYILRSLVDNVLLYIYDKISKTMFVVSKVGINIPEYLEVRMYKDIEIDNSMDIPKGINLPFCKIAPIAISYYLFHPREFIINNREKDIHSFIEGLTGCIEDNLLSGEFIKYIDGICLCGDRFYDQFGCITEAEIYIYDSINKTLAYIDYAKTYNKITRLTNVDLDDISKVLNELELIDEIPLCDLLKVVTMKSARKMLY
jgi:hypothetical protein